jgi:hypothetical protein
MFAELISVALLPFAFYSGRYDDESPPEESAAQAHYEGRRNVLHADSVGCFSNSAQCSPDWSLSGRRRSAVICDTWRAMPRRDSAAAAGEDAPAEPRQSQFGVPAPGPRRSIGLWSPSDRDRQGSQGLVGCQSTASCRCRRARPDQEQRKFASCEREEQTVDSCARAAD